MSGAPVLRLTGISKRFGALVANDNISLSLQQGEVLALLGENGAGKSTLVSILFGHYVADAGTIEVRGQPLPAGNPAAALAAGIGMVHQHFTLAENLSVLDNVMLGTEPLWRPWSARREGRGHLMDLAARFGLAVEPEARVGDLSVGERQRVEILKALYRGASILILDEPTAVLTPQESEALFATLTQMVGEGLSIVFISHKLQEVLRVSHRVAVLRAGRLVAQADAHTSTPAELARWMMGHDPATPSKQTSAHAGDASIRPTDQHAPDGAVRRLPIVCRLERLSVTQGALRDHLHELSLQLHAGEIAGIAGVAGNGQETLARLLFGTAAPDHGHIELLGEAMPANPRAAVARGIARVPQDRQGTAVVGDLSLAENMVAEHLHSPAFSRGRGLRLIRRAAVRQHASAVQEQFDVRGAGIESPARQLSGGNLQKLVLGRVLQPPPGVAAARLIVAHQPTWGLDVGAVSAIHARLRAAAQAGAAVLVLSDDLDEILSLCDRVAVMQGGRLTAMRATTAWSREAMGLAMAAHPDGKPSHSTSAGIANPTASQGAASNSGQPMEPGVPTP